MCKDSNRKNVDCISERINSARETKLCVRKTDLADRYREYGCSHATLLHILKTSVSFVLPVTVIESEIRQRICHQDIFSSSTFVFM
jgi:hypothetical protein